MIVSESKPAAADLFSENAVFFEEVIQRPLLIFVQPTCDASNDDGKWSENRGHSGILPRMVNSGAFRVFNEFEFPYHTGWISSSWTADSAQKARPAETLTVLGRTDTRDPSLNGR